jgi:hypothetical protein
LKQQWLPFDNKDSSQHINIWQIPPAYLHNLRRGEIWSDRVACCTDYGATYSIPRIGTNHFNL